MSVECGDCRFWEVKDIAANAAGDRGLCRRHAPSAVAVIKGAEFEARWPSTDDFEWCGEHQPQPNKTDSLPAAKPSASMPL